MNKLLTLIENPVLGNFGNQKGDVFFSKLFGAVISTFFIIGIVVFVVMLLYGGIKMMTSGGEKPNVQGSRSIITNAVIGLFIVLLFYAILNILECFFGFGFRQFTIGPFKISPVTSSVCKNSGGGGGTTTPTPPPVGTVNALCHSCIGGGCGITGRVYVGPCTGGFCRCTSTSGWQSASGPATSSTCLPCP